MNLAKVIGSSASIGYNFYQKRIVSDRKAEEMRSKNENLMKQILDYTENFRLQFHRFPSINEITKALSIVKSTVYRYLVEMNERGMLSYHDGEIETEKTKKLSPITKSAAILGSVSCGLLQLEEEYVEEYVSLPVSLFGTESFLSCG